MISKQLTRLVLPTLKIRRLFVGAVASDPPFHTVDVALSPTVAASSLHTACSVRSVPFRRGFCMPITLDDFDVDPETKPVLRVALEMTRVSLGLADDFATGSSPSASSNLPRPASAIPISCVKAQLRNCAGICTETDRG